jgi:hypothetical protein
MPLNETQRTTLREVLKLAVDAILESKRVDLLRSCVADNETTVAAALATLGQNAVLYSALLPAGSNNGVDQIAIPAGVRTAWAQVHKVIRGEAKVCLLNAGSRR